MFALAMENPLTVLHSISNNLKDHHHQTKDKAENNTGFRGLSHAVFFLACKVTFKILFSGKS